MVDWNWPEPLSTVVATEDFQPERDLRIVGRQRCMSGLLDLCLIMQVRPGGLVLAYWACAGPIDGEWPEMRVIEHLQGPWSQAKAAFHLFCSQYPGPPHMRCCWLELV